MSRRTKVRTVSLFGRQVRIVYTSPQGWTEQLSTGQLVHHPGKVHDQLPAGKWLDEPKPCSKCKQPCQTTTPHGRAVHPTCEGWCDLLTDELHAQVIFDVAAELGAQVLTSPNTSPKESRRDRAA